VREKGEIRYGVSWKSNFLMEGKTMAVGGDIKKEFYGGRNPGKWERLKYGVVEITEAFIHRDDACHTCCSVTSDVSFKRAI
jgi:hypothetical protein